MAKKAKASDKRKVRLHLKSSKALLDFLQYTGKTFVEEKTATGFPSYKLGRKEVYIRDKRTGPGSVNRIAAFQRGVAQSTIYKYVNVHNKEDVEKECDEIHRTILYKGFTFDPIEEPKIEGAIKIDLDTAYWHAFRYARMIDKSLYNNVIDNCIKDTRLKITGSLGKRLMSTPFTEGLRGKTVRKEESKKRVVYRNIYNRIRKFVDELMVWCWQCNPENFIGYYVDCFWLREYDQKVIDTIKQMFSIKIESVNVEIQRNRHGKYRIEEVSRDTGEITEYDARFKYNNFVNYKYFHNFTADLMSNKINFKTTWIKPTDRT